MRDRQEQRAHARTLTLLVAGLIFLIYLLLEGEQGDVVHVFRDERHLYFSLGEYGSFQIYELRRPRPQSQPGLVTAPGDPQRKVYFSSVPLDKSRTVLDQPQSDLKIKRGDVTRAIARDNTLYVVDPNQGLIIYDITLRTAPIEIGRYEFYDIHDLVFFEQIAFVAAGKAGIYLLDLAHPDLIQVLGHYDTAGSAETVLPVFINFGEMSIQADAEVGQVQEQIFQQYLAFVADGDSGYVILDFKTAEPVFRELQLLRAENTPGFASDISFRDSYLFLADGKAGIRIFDIFSGGFDPANPTFLGVFDTPGTAYQISLRRNEMLIADGEAGLLVANLNSLLQSQSITAIAILPTPAEITSLVISKDIAVLGGGEQGVFIADISDPSHPVLVDKLSTPGLSSLSQIFEAAWNRSWSAKETASLYDMGKEILIASVVFLFLILVLIPYIIPSSSLAAALSSVFLFVRYLFGRVGPAILVEAGEIKTDPLAQETNTTRPVILDNSSVGLVRDSQGSLHIAVPGTSRLYPGEALVETIDLQSRTFIFGPADEDPFEPQQPNEDEIMARHRARRRAETQAFTQDGAEIVPNLIVDFRVKSTSYSGTAPFGFHSGYAFQALRQEYAADKTFVEGHHPSSSLNGLPGMLAVRAWREVLPYFTLDDLFSPLDGNDGLAGQRLKFGFEFIVDCVNQLLRQQFVDEIGQHGRLTGNQVFSEAYNELEQAGLEVQRVWIVNPRIVPEIHDEFLGRFFSAWDAQVQEFQLRVQARYDEIEAVSRQQALVDFARISIQSLAEGLQRYQSMPANFLFLNRSLYLLLRGTSSLGRIDNEDKMQLNSLLDWLESNLET